MSEVEDYAKELKEQYNTAVKITKEEDTEITKALEFYDDVGDIAEYSPFSYGRPYTEVCIVYERPDDGIIKLAIFYRGTLYDEKIFRKNPYTGSGRGFIDRIKAYLYDNLQKCIFTLQSYKMDET